MTMDGAMADLESSPARRGEDAGSIVGGGAGAIALAAARTMRAGYRNARPRDVGGGTRPALFVLMRVTGLALSVLVLGHFALTHIFNDVADTGSAFVARRWGSALWVTWDALMLATAITHGAAGVWIAIDDYTPIVAARKRRRAVLVALSAAALALGIITIVVAET